ncbi:hypothetical protein [Sinorhizobium sp. BG8]|uniref:hypothetical protein n=1 Tax=Sinorhizobium sp. BG8 TaxID=2613773 RepID=UPI00193E4C87|nr:hypothetical protein [Sinorhizobium sp. BG8]QRM54218.1 hypothetical protein F3Y30_06385 [Sinorhizobium sp. BG8]
MRKCTYSAEREKIVAEAICPVATELRLLDAADLVSLLRFECYGNLSDLVASAAELYFLPGTVNFGSGGDYRLDWGTEPEVTLDMELRPPGVTVYAKLLLQKDQAGVEVTHVAFSDPAANPDDNTAFLEKSLREARFVRSTDAQASSTTH